MQSGWQQPEPGRGSGSGTSTAEIVVGVATTLGLHGLILALAIASVFFSSKEEEQEFLHVAFEEVQLLALGEIRDPDALPRLSGGDPPPAVQEVILDEPEPEAVAPEPTPEPEPQVEREPEPDPEMLRRQREEEERQREAEREAERERQREERQRRREQALGRLGPDGPGNEAPEGSPDGVAGGTVSDAALADMRATYQVRVRQELERFWEVPVTISDDELERLAGQVRVSVRVSESGHIVSYRFLSNSDNPQFDDSIERVLQRFERHRGGRTLPMPEQPELRAEILRGGMNLSNWRVTNR